MFWLACFSNFFIFRIGVTEANSCDGDLRYALGCIGLLTFHCILNQCGRVLTNSQVRNTSKVNHVVYQTPIAAITLQLSQWIPQEIIDCFCTVSLS